MARVTEDYVKSVLAPGHDYDTLENPSLTPFITAANLRVSWCVDNASSYGRTAMSTDVAKEVEAWLAAGMYKFSDQQLSSSQAGRSSGQFRGQSTMKANANQYVMNACMMDTSNMLAAALEGRIAGASWLGKVPSEQIPYSDRN